MFSLEAAFLAASFTLALLFLGFRNIYDDEVASFNLIGDSAGNIIRISNSEDVHPPGMYLLSHAAYVLIPSPRWMTVVPLLVFYAGLAVFVFAVSPLFTRKPSRVCFLLLGTLHPHLLMWSNSIRWYGWWTGMALLVLTIALQPRKIGLTNLTYGRAALLGVLLACLFYVNYITLLFTAALFLSVLLRYSFSIWRQSLVTLACFILLIAPQLRPFLTVHMPASGHQRGSLIVSAARTLQSLSASEAYLPWHPLALIAVVIFLCFAIAGLTLAMRFARKSGDSFAEGRRQPVISILAFAAIFLVLVVFSGLGAKPRNGLLLIPVLAPAAALVFGEIKSRLLQNALLGFFAVWIAVGLAHLIGRRGLSKAGMNDRPEQVLDFVRDSRETSCSVTMTYDPEVTFTMARSRLPHSLVLGYGPNSMYRGAPAFDPRDCSHIELYVVRSYLGGYRNGQDLLNELARAQHFIGSPVKIESFGFDPDAQVKRKLSSLIPGAAGLPDYRYVVSSGEISPLDLVSMRSQLRLFIVEDGVTQPALPGKVPQD